MSNGLQLSLCKEVEVLDEVNVLVVGCGVAGMTAQDRGRAFGR